jgi:phosphatidylserine/phosphatidylglycerophosphate/cardiolipin synthase-like enzyme
MELLLNEAIYKRVIVELLPTARKFLWIVTADIKDLHVPKGRKFVPLLEILSDLIGSGVTVRLMHAKEPGPRFREDFDRYPNLLNAELFERVLCPRIHTKTVIVDGKHAFIGSANLTGAGLGAKSAHKRNFEAGFLTQDKTHIQEMMEWVDELYLGSFCRKCGRRSTCPDPIA